MKIDSIEIFGNSMIQHGKANDRVYVMKIGKNDCPDIVDFEGENAEMTDFVTLPDFRGSGLATYMLDRMEAGMKQIGIKTAYTIARAYSFGMNITFAKHGYTYSGTLTNNTQISGDLESMNVWYKHL